MTVAYPPEPSPSEDPLYRAAMTSMQDGKWAQALDSLSSLAARYPENSRVQSALEMAQFKADLDAGSRVRAKNWILPGWSAFVPLFVLAVLAIFVLLAVRFTNSVMRPMLAEAQQTRQIEGALTQAEGLAEQERFDEARTLLQEKVLVREPDKVRAKGLLSTIEYKSQVLDLYRKAVALMDEGDYGTSTIIFQDIAGRHPEPYKDVNQRLARIDRLVEQQQLYLQADLLDKMGEVQRNEAIAAYEALQELNPDYQKSRVEERLIALYLQEAQAIVAEADPDRLPAALALLNKLIQLAPRHDQGLPERNLVRNYLDGAEAHAAGEWQDAVDGLEKVYEVRPDFVGGLAVELLYDSLIELADEYQANGDVERANQLYSQARSLPVDDTGRARSGLAQTSPTATPAPVVPARSVAFVGGVGGPVPDPPTPTPVPPTPTPTPSSILAQGGRIVFKSDNRDQPGFWAMDASGENRTYLGNNADLERQYNELQQAEAWSGERLLFVRDGGNSAQIWLAEKGGGDRQITFFYGVSYNPVWSPDGQHIAFVSQEHRSDDIWTSWADGAEPRKLTNNTWEWDKHPSWSPDGGQIVFWSNRTGVKQIWVMGAGGDEQRNISNVGWDEYDPIWVK